VIGQATCIVVAEAHARVLRIAIGKLLSVVRASWSAVHGYIRRMLWNITLQYSLFSSSDDVWVNDVFDYVDS
jgi:hypothetical protein